MIHVLSSCVRLFDDRKQGCSISKNLNMTFQIISRVIYLHMEKRLPQNGALGYSFQNISPITIRLVQTVRCLRSFRKLWTRDRSCLETPSLIKGHLKRMGPMTASGMRLRSFYSRIDYSLHKPICARKQGQETELCCVMIGSLVLLYLL